MTWPGLDAYVNACRTAGDQALKLVNLRLGRSRGAFWLRRC